ncbi:MAG TPA: hypothetical protein VGZ93_02890 [Candidatus Methylacidiphilales bacterium]|jgi:hypothetical protein|nr:hypothetical protein [Candidatus Methylacidiphilales bacterium]
MDKQEAKQVLQALRPDDLRTGKPVVVEALALVEGDPELKAWWKAQQAFDLRVAAKLKEIPLPDNLRATIMAGRKIERFRPQPRLSFWLAAAAAVAILCVAGTLMRSSAYGPIAQTDYADAVLPRLNHDAPDLAMTSADHDKIAAWLKEQNAPMGTLPAKMTALSTIGCQKFLVHGHTVSLICFAIQGGGIAHLFIVDEEALSDPPEVNSPEFHQVENWSTAAWSDGRMSYLLATQAGPDTLRQLL